MPQAIGILSLEADASSKLREALDWPAALTGGRHGVVGILRRG